MPAKKCPHCQAVYREAEWSRLEICERVPPEEVGRLVRGWPEAWCIEVRRCARCGRTVAAKWESGSARGEQRGHVRESRE